MDCNHLEDTNIDKYWLYSLCWLIWKYIWGEEKEDTNINQYQLQFVYQLFANIFEARVRRTQIWVNINHISYIDSFVNIFEARRRRWRGGPQPFDGEGRDNRFFVILRDEIFNRKCFMTFTEGPWWFWQWQWWVLGGCKRLEGWVHFQAGWHTSFSIKGAARLHCTSMLGGGK